LINVEGDQPGTSNYG